MVEAFRVATLANFREALGHDVRTEARPLAHGVPPGWRWHQGRAFRCWYPNLKFGYGTIGG
jgi:hypothetical protein